MRPPAQPTGLGLALTLSCGTHFSCVFDVQRHLQLHSARHDTPSVLSLRVALFVVPFRVGQIFATRATFGDPHKQLIFLPHAPALSTLERKYLDVFPSFSACCCRIRVDFYRCILDLRLRTCRSCFKIERGVFGFAVLSVLRPADRV